MMISMLLVASSTQGIWQWSAGAPVDAMSAASGLEICRSDGDTGTVLFFADYQSRKVLLTGLVSQVSFLLPPQLKFL